jgi:multicomponent Na+:H+ antiporter subunit D
MTAAELHPALLLIAAGLASAGAPRLVRQVFALAAPLVGLVLVWSTPLGTVEQAELFGLLLEPLRLDALSFPFAVVFLIAAFLNGIYALHQDDRLQDAAALVYAGAGLGAVLAGDLVTLFIFWEITAVSSAFLIWASRNERAYRATMRYLAWQVGSGLLLLAGIVVYWHATGSLDFEPMSLTGLAAWLIFIAFGIKCAFPFLHPWLQDAYPEATATGTVVLSAFTTKMAVYVFARAFAGESLLIPIGAAMTAFPVFFAVIENDLRRVLSFSLNNQVGFMIVAVGIGTPLALNGAVSHAFVHIIYKSLLFMSMGAVLYRVGTCKASELGGLHKSMPLTTVFCIIGAISIAGFPLTSGFIAKTQTLGAAAELGFFWTWIVMIFASAGVMEHSGIKIPYFAFFAHDQGHRVKEAPLNMLIAMGLASAACIGIGIFPDPLFSILPSQQLLEPYTAENVITKAQLLSFAVLAFAILVRTGLYVQEIPSTNLNFDWFYRVPGKWLALRAMAAITAVGEEIAHLRRLGMREIGNQLYPVLGPQGALARTWSVGFAVLLVTAVLGLSLLFNFFWQLPG